MAAALGLIALALTARALGPEQLGLLALIEAYARVVDRLIRLEPWQALIKYGADALEGDRPEDFRSLLKFGVLVDAGGAACSAVVAVAFVVIAGPWLGWSEQTVQMAAVYSASLLFQLSATPIAVLRLFDRFGVFAWLEVATAAARVALFAVAFLTGAGLWTFLLLVMALSVAYHSGAGPDRMARVASSGPRRVPQGARGRRRNALSQDLEFHLVAPSIVPGPPQHRRSGHAAHRGVARSRGGRPVSRRQTLRRRHPQGRRAHPAGAVPGRRTAVGATRDPATAPYRHPDRPDRRRPGGGHARRRRAERRSRSGSDRRRRVRGRRDSRDPAADRDHHGPVRHGAQTRLAQHGAADAVAEDRDRRDLGLLRHARGVAARARGGRREHRPHRAQHAVAGRRLPDLRQKDRGGDPGGRTRCRWRRAAEPAARGPASAPRRLQAAGRVPLGSALGIAGGFHAAWPTRGGSAARGAPALSAVHMERSRPISSDRRATSSA